MFYVDSGLGNWHHTYHHPINRSAVEAECLNDIEQDDEDFIKDIADGQEADFQIQNIVFKKTEKLIPRHTIRQITHYKKRTIVNDSDFSDIFYNQENKDLSPTEHILRYC